MDKYITYWYVNKNGIRLAQSKPNANYITQTVSTIGIPDMRSVKYEYNDQVYHKVMPMIDVDNQSTIYSLLNGGEVE